MNGTQDISYLLINNDLHSARAPHLVIEGLKSQEIIDEIVPATILVAFCER